MSELKLAELEKKLEMIPIPRLSILDVKGYGEYKNTFQDGWIESRCMIEIVIEESKSREVINAIMDAVSTGEEGDGIITVIPVLEAYLIRTKKHLYEKSEQGESRL